MCVIRDEVFTENRGIMDYNLTLFKDSVREILLDTQHLTSNAQENGQSNEMDKLNPNSSISTSVTSMNTLNDSNSTNNFILGGTLLTNRR